MRKALPFCLVLALLVAVAVPSLATTRSTDVSGTVKALNGSPTFLGTVAVHDAGTTNNWNTPLPDAGAITPFDAGFGNLLLIQCEQGTYIAAGNSSTTATARGLKLDTDEKFYLLLKGDQSAIAIKPTSTATGYCDLYTVE